MTRLGVVVLHYRTLDLTAGALLSLAPEVAADPEVEVVVVDNASGDGSAEALAFRIAKEGWERMSVVSTDANGGFASGMNRGMAEVDAAAWLLLNSDARLLPGSLAALRRVLREHPDAGLVGVQLVGPDERPHPSAFRDRTPLGELVRAAGLSRLDALLPGHVVALPLADDLRRVDWVSFACVAVTARARSEVGPLDEGFFMYYEDVDYARRVRAAGLSVLQDPGVRAVHLRGGSSSVKAAVARRERVPRYYYASRARYFAKHFGRAGLLAANGCWHLGRCLSRVAELATGRDVHACRREGADNWTGWWRPLAAPDRPGEEEL